ncbi:MAG: cobalamin-dependent protein [Chloroflexi bacterium]|nr:cobalamin-dependent protein [Chloroflexota bacterium]
MSDSLIDAIINLEEKAALSKIRAASEGGIDPLAIIEECRQGLQVVGERFDREEYFLSELIVGAEIFRQAVEILGPALEARKVAGGALGRVVIGTVKGDIHDLGKNVVVAMLSASGFQVHDLGVDVPKDRFVEAVRQVRPQVLGISALLTLSFNEMRDTIQALKDAGLRDGLGIMVGGGPVNEAVKDYVGADVVGRNAAHAVEIAKQLAGVS